MSVCTRVKKTHNRLSDCAYVFVQTQEKSTDSRVFCRLRRNTYACALVHTHTQRLDVGGAGNRGAEVRPGGEGLLERASMQAICVCDGVCDTGCQGTSVHVNRVEPAPGTRRGRGEGGQPTAPNALHTRALILLGARQPPHRVPFPGTLLMAPLSCCKCPLPPFLPCLHPTPRLGSFLLPPQELMSPENDSLQSGTSLCSLPATVKSLPTPNPPPTPTHFCLPAGQPAQTSSYTTSTSDLISASYTV